MATARPRPRKADYHDTPLRLPDFLIIGAMKAGTTSLYRDLDVNPNVFLAADKEPGDLARDAVREPRGLAGYARLARSNF